ncbi:MAG TPA: hypothetical protein VIG33_06175 [Pseudobdellovibrionaceae bacterium]|jgi:hypothetical protein
MNSAEAIFNFLENGQISPEENFYYCQTRDRASSRLPKWMSYFQNLGLSEHRSAILTAIIGELTNNSFDHNLGKWKEPAGCAVAFEKQDDLLNIYIADRGQGIISSLGSSLTATLPPDIILKKAFEERISGRAPERRGNGLKFVLKHLQESNNSLYCVSQGYIYSIGPKPKSISEEHIQRIFSTLVVIQWSIK